VEQWLAILCVDRRWIAGTYSLVLVVLEHVLREVGDGPRERDVAVVALVLDGGTAETQTAADEASGRGLEVTVLYAGLDDVLAEILEAGGRVLRLGLLDLALTALDARRGQYVTIEGFAWGNSYSAGSLTLPVCLSW
jgi:hypothetical protein